jgi:hypothetical protein
MKMRSNLLRWLPHGIKQGHPSLAAVRAEVSRTDLILAEDVVEQPVASLAWEQEIEERAGIKLYLRQREELEKERQAG